MIKVYTRQIVWLLLIGLVSSLAGCSFWNNLNPTEKGALVGIGTGAVGGTVGTVIGGVSGGLAGGVIGNETSKYHK